MKCYFQRWENDAPWIKGRITSMDGGGVIYFSAQGMKEILIYSPAVRFDCGDPYTFMVSGFEKLSEDMSSFKFTTVQVRTLKPKEMKQEK